MFFLDIDRERNQEISELKSKQQAEIEARKGNIDQDQLKLLLQAHASALEEAEDDLNRRHLNQKALLAARLAKMRKDKTEKLAENHDVQLASERARTKQEAEEQKREKDIEVEKEAAIKIISETDNPNSSQIVEAILGRRHKAEIDALNDEWRKIRADRLAKALENYNPEDDIEAIKARINNQTDVDQASALLKLQERHYQEKLALLTECAPAAARNAEKDAERMAKARRQIEIEKASREEKQRAERAAWEAEEKQRNDDELISFEASLAKEIDDEGARMEAELNEKREKRDKVEQQRKQNLEDELKAKLASKSDQDQTKLIREHEQKLLQMDEKRDLDHQRMQEQIQKRLEAKRQKMVNEKEEEIKHVSEENEKHFNEKRDKEVVNVEEAIKPIIEETTETAGPLTKEQLETALENLPVVGSLKEIQKFLGKKFLDSDVEYGDISIVPLDQLDGMELINYRYLVWLLQLFQSRLGIGNNLQIKISDRLPKVIPSSTEVKNEFSSDLLGDSQTIILRRRTLSSGVGQLSVLLSYGFARYATDGKKMQDTFFGTQSVLMNDGYFLLNATDRKAQTFIQN